MVLVLCTLKSGFRTHKGVMPRALDPAGVVLAIVCGLPAWDSSLEQWLCQALKGLFLRKERLGIWELQLNFTQTFWSSNPLLPSPETWGIFCHRCYWSQSYRETNLNFSNTTLSYRVWQIPLSTQYSLFLQNELCNGCKLFSTVGLQADLGDPAGSVTDHRNKANVAIKRVIGVFWFPCAYKKLCLHYTVVF